MVTKQLRKLEEHFKVARDHIGKLQTQLNELSSVEKQNDGMTLFQCQRGKKNPNETKCVLRYLHPANYVQRSKRVI